MLFSTIYNSTIATNQNTIPIVILHGFLGMSDNWKTLAMKYAEQNFEVHAVDLRNHGRSFHSEVFNYDVMTQDLADYFTEKNIKKCHLMGHSMGGKLAMFFGTKYPNMVEKLIIADIAPKFYEPHHDDILNGLQSINFESKPSRAAVDATLTLYITDFGTRQFLLKNLYWQTPGQLAFRFNLQAFLKNKSSVGEALKVNSIFTKPTLFIVGGASKYVVTQDLELIKKHFPDAVVETIPNVGHWLHAENPEVFFDITLAFLLQ